MFGSWPSRHFYTSSVSTAWICLKLFKDYISDTAIYSGIILISGKDQSEDINIRYRRLRGARCAIQVGRHNFKIE